MRMCDPKPKRLLKQVQICQYHQTSKRCESGPIPLRQTEMDSPFLYTLYPGTTAFTHAFTFTFTLIFILTCNWQFSEAFFLWDRHVNKFVSAKMSRRVNHDRPCAKLRDAPVDYV